MADGISAKTQKEAMEMKRIYAQSGIDSRIEYVPSGDYKYKVFPIPGLNLN